MRAFLALVIWIAASSIAFGQAAAVDPKPTSTMSVSATGEVSVLPLPALPPDQIQMIEVPQKSLIERLTDGSFLAQIGVLFVLLLGFMRALADLLLWVSAKTDNKWDNKLADAISEASWYLGVMVGKMGWSTPKAVLKEVAASGPKEPKAG